jgi:Heparinase II/III-like protein/Heparinase II/III N-terminus
MSPAEMVSRFADVGRHVALSLSLERIQNRARKSPRYRTEPFALRSLNGQLDATPPQVKKHVIDFADQWLKHRANFFALRGTPLGEPINWHCDYSSGVTAPIKYSGLVNYRNVTVAGDVKYIWELNRLQHLVTLALAMAWTGNDAYGKEIERQTLSWQSQNPFMMGLNWKSPLEAGMRLISWAYVLFLTSGSHQAEGIYPNWMREIIYLHQYFIKKFYSKNSSANNHLIGEMVGLYVGAVFWPWYRESAGWRAFARRKLIEEMFRQVEADGVGKERATEYQAFIIELFLIAGSLGQLIREPFPQKYWDRLNQMLGFLSALCNRAGDLPIFGDGDSAQAIWLPETTPERVRDLIRLSESHEANALNSDLRSQLLLWGQAPHEIPIGPVGQSRDNLEVFPDGGYCVLASDRGGENEILAVVDGGPLGLPPLNAHGHADALSFWLSYGGREFLIDPGTYCYQSSSLWRSYFRGTGAHNTIRIDGENQSIPGGTFLWREAAQCRIEQVEHTDEFVDVRGSHDGYRRLPDPVVHARSLRLFKKSRVLLITDRVECQGTHDIEFFFHFSEKCQVRQAGANSFEVASSNKRLAILIDSRFKPELYRGSEDPIFGWISRTFGVKTPCFTLVARAGITGSTEFRTEITAL